MDRCVTQVTGPYTACQDDKIDLLVIRLANCLSKWQTAASVKVTWVSCFSNYKYNKPQLDPSRPAATSCKHPVEHNEDNHHANSS